MTGSVLRLRPKLMTVSVTIAALVPIMWSTGVGADVMDYPFEALGSVHQFPHRWLVLVG